MTEEKKVPAIAYLTLDDQVLIDQCEVDLFRASGPGGQKRNKTSSAVRLRHKPTGLIATAVEERSQHVNKARAVRRLRLTIALQSRTEVNPDEFKLSEEVQDGVADDGRILMGKRDRRYPVFVCELLDLLEGCDMQIKRAAEVLGVTTSRLVSYFKDDPKVWERVNQMRSKAGLKSLR